MMKLNNYTKFYNISAHISGDIWKENCLKKFYDQRSSLTARSRCLRCLARYKEYRRIEGVVLSQGSRWRCTAGVRRRGRRASAAPTRLPREGPAVRGWRRAASSCQRREQVRPVPPPSCLSRATSPPPPAWWAATADPTATPVPAPTTMMIGARRPSSTSDASNPSLSASVNWRQVMTLTSPEKTGGWRGRASPPSPHTGSNPSRPSMTSAPLERNSPRFSNQAVA